MKLHKLLTCSKTALGILWGSRAFGGPLQANLSLTNRCNIKCHHCYYHSPLTETPAFRQVRGARLAGRKTPNQAEIERFRASDADDAKMRQLIDALLSMGTYRFHFSGGGEPFMHRNAMEYIERIKNTGRVCEVNTNGLLLGWEMMDRLIDMRCDALRITTLGGTPKMYAASHVSGADGKAFETLEAVLEYLSESKKSRRINRPEVTLVCVITKNNISGLAEVASFATRVGADSVHYRSMDNAGDVYLERLVPLEEQIPDIRQQLFEAGELLDRNGVRHNIDALSATLKARLDTTAFYKDFPCYYGWLSLSIDADGQLYFCCRAFEPLGNVFEADFKMLWNTPLYQRRRSEARRLPELGKPILCCDCYSCIHLAANYKVARFMKPFKSRGTSGFGK